MSANGSVHQFVPMLHRHDAVGQHTLAVQALLRSRGVASEIFVELDDPDTADVTLRFRDYASRAAPRDVLVYQMATDSDLADWLRTRPERLVVNYHNITPPELFAPWDTSLALHQVRARRQLAEFAGRAALGVAVSAFNRADLDAAGFRRTEVVPPAIGLAGPALPDGAADAGAATRATASRWLSVGRIAPNKAIEDTIAALLWYRTSVDPDATLQVIGRAAVAPYAGALRRFAADLGLAEAVRFAGSVDIDHLVAAYDGADVLVVTSEHEGFCLPVVEAFGRRLPVVAYHQGALGEVMGDAGVLVDRKDPRAVADAVHRLATDPAARARSVEQGSERLRALDLDTAGERLVALLCRLRDEPPAAGR
jgi:glycosyltransferase involved in cell wall biosynthesis